MSVSYMSPQLTEALIYTWTQNYIPNSDKISLINKNDEFRLLHNCSRIIIASSIDVRDTQINELFDKIAYHSLGGVTLIKDALDILYKRSVTATYDFARSYWMGNHKSTNQVHIQRCLPYIKSSPLFHGIGDSLNKNNRVMLLVVVIDGELTTSGKWYNRTVDVGFHGKIEEYEIDYEIFLENLIREGYARDILSYFN